MYNGSYPPDEEHNAKAIDKFVASDKVLLLLRGNYIHGFIISYGRFIMTLVDL